MVRTPLKLFRPALVLAWALTPVRADVPVPETHAPAKLALTEQSVIDRALHLLQVTNTGRVLVTARRVEKPELIVPNLPIEPIWRVHLENAPLKFRWNGTLRTNPFVKSLDMDFSERTGQLVRLKTDWPDDLPGSRFPTMESYEQQTPGLEPVFVGLPEDPPRSYLVDALGNGLANVWNAKQVVVFYVMGAFPASRPEVLAKPLWVVHVAGIPHLSIRMPPGLSPEQRQALKEAQERLTYKRTLIDAETGVCIRSDGIPEP
jgi:hypothetical protein